MTLEVQFLSLAWMLISGMLMGVAFDVYRVFQSLLRLRLWMIHVLDFIYWLGATLLVFVILLQNNEGQLRLYLFVALAVGLWFYFANCSSYTIKIVISLISIIQRIWQFFCYLVEVLIIRPLYLLLVIGAWIGQVGMSFVWGLTVGLFRMLRPLVILFYPFQKLFLWITRPLIRKVYPWYASICSKIQILWNRLRNWLKK